MDAAMELASLQIRIDSREAKTAKEWLDELTDSGGRTEKSMGGVGRGGKAAAAGSAEAARGSRTATAALNQQDAAAARLTATIRRYAIAAAGVFSVSAIARQARNVTELASRYNELGIVMGTVGRNAGYSRPYLDELERSLKATGISALESRSNIAKLIAANIDLSKATELARLAQDAAVIGGLNSSDAFARLTSGIQSAQVETLRTMGLNANFQKSYEDLAAELGKTEKDLTELEKTQARTNAVLALAPTIAGAYEASMENAGKQMRSTERYAEDLGVALGQAFQPAYEAAVSAYTRILKTAAENVDFLERTMVAFSLSGIALVSGGLMMLATRAIPAVITQMSALTLAMMKNPFGLIAVAAAAAITYMVTLKDKAAEFNREMDALGAVWDTISDAASSAWGVITDGLEAILGKASSTSSDISMAFDDSFRDIAIELDNLYGLMAGTWAALEKVVSVTAQNLYTYVRNAFIDIYEFAMGVVISIARGLEAITGVEISIGMNALEKEKILSFADEVKKAFDAANVGFGAEAAYDAAIAIRQQKRAVDMINESLAEQGYTTGIVEKETAKLTQTTTKNTAKTSAAAKAAAAFERQRQQALRAQYAAISAIHEEAQGIEDQVLLFGLSKTALEDLTIARLEEQAAMLRGFDGSEEQVDIIEREIEARKRLRTAMGSHERIEEEARAREERLSEWQRETDQMSQTLTDALMRGFEDGKSFGKNFADTLKNMFRTLVLRPIIEPIMQDVAGGIQGAFGQQRQMGSGGSMPSFNTMMGGGIGNSLASAGSLIGSSMVSQFGAGLTAGAGGALSSAGATALMDIGVGGSSAFSAGSSIGNMGLGSIMGYGAALLSLTEGNYGQAAGTAIGTAILPGIGTAVGGFIGSLVDGIFGDEPKTRRGKSTIYELDATTQDIYRKHDEIRQDDAYYTAMEDMTRASMDGIRRTFDLVGVDAQLGNFWSRTDISTTGRGDGVASGGGVMVGGKWVDIGIPHATDDTSRGVGGWSDEPVLPRLALDLQLTALEAFQAASEQLPSVLADMLEGADIRGMGVEAAQALAAAFDAVIQQVGMLQTAVESLPFESLRDLSFDAAANLIHFAGGLEQLDAGMTSYFQNFYSEAEQLEWQAGQLSGAFESLGLEMPDVTSGAKEAKAAYREIVESLDLTTESGQQSYAMLMTLSGGFAELVTGMDELAGATDTVNQALQQRTNLESQLASLIGNTSMMRRRELDAMDESNHALQMLIWGYQDAVAATNAAFSAVQRLGQEEIARLQQTTSATDAALSALERASQSTMTSLRGVFDLLERSVREMRGQVESTAQMQYIHARAMISTALVTGQVSDGDAMQVAIRAARQGVETGVYSSKFEQDRAYLTLAAEMEQLQGISGRELTAAEETLDLARKQVNALRGIDDRVLTASEAARELQTAIAAEDQAMAQISIIQEQLDWAQLQYDALRGLGDQFTTFAGAIDGLASSFATERAAQQAVNNAINQPGLSREQQYLINNPDVAAEFITDPLANSMGADQFARWHWDKYGQHEAGRPSFAVGTSYVPYDMTADIHRGEMVIDPRSSDILRNYGINVQGGGNERAVQNEIRALRGEMKSALFAIAKSTNKTVKRLEDQERLDREIGYDIVSAIEAIA